MCVSFLWEKIFTIVAEVGHRLILESELPVALSFKCAQIIMSDQGMTNWNRPVPGRVGDIIDLTTKCLELYGRLFSIVYMRNFPSDKET